MKIRILKVQCRSLKRSGTVAVHFLISYILPPSFYSTFHVTSQMEPDNARKSEKKKQKMFNL